MRFANHLQMQITLPIINFRGTHWRDSTNFVTILSINFNSALKFLTLMECWILELKREFIFPSWLGKNMILKQTLQKSKNNSCCQIIYQMKVTLNWLKQYVDFDWSPEQLAERLTMLGLEVEGVHKTGGEFDGIVVAQILTRDPVPGSDKLSVCKVNDGKGERVII